MTRAEFAARLKNACAAVTAAEAELTEIDSKFGDADHGLTMAKIAGAISEAVDAAEGGIQSMLDDAAMAVMTLNGGSAVPLWNTWLDGLQEEAPEGEEIDKITKISPTAFHYYYCLLLFTTCAGDFPDSVKSLRRIHLGRPP